MLMSAKLAWKNIIESNPQTSKSLSEKHDTNIQVKGTLDSELAIVLSSIALACKQIASLVNRAGISNLTGLAGVANIQVLFVSECQSINIAIEIEDMVVRVPRLSSYKPYLQTLVQQSSQQSFSDDNTSLL